MGFYLSHDPDVLELLCPDCGIHTLFDPNGGFDAAVECFTCGRKFSRSDIIGDMKTLADDAGSRAAQYQYGRYLLSTGADKKEALKYLLKSAGQEYIEAMYSLGLQILQDKESGRKLEIAIDFLDAAAKKGHARAQYYLAACYYYGHGVKQDYRTAVKWFHEASKQGHAGAQFSLGVCLLRGQGIEQNEKSAVKCFLAAADQGNADAQFNLGVCLLHGQGIERNEKSAARYFALAAEQGHAEAKRRLASLQDRT